MKRIHAAVAFTFFAVSTLPAYGDYVAYSVSDGERRPLPEKIDNIEADKLLNLEWGSYGGKKSRVGVLEVDNNSSSSTFIVSGALGTTVNYSSAETGVPVNGIEAIVVDTMNRSGRFRMVEREQKALQSVMTEQDLGASGRVAQPSAAKIGKILGAEYLVQVVVTNYEPDTSGKDIGVGGLARKVPLLGGVKIKNRKGQVGMNFRLIDAETSEIVYTQQVESVIKESGLTFGGAGASGAAILGGFVSDYAKTPIGQAVIAGINEGVYELIKEIGTSSAQGSIVKADANQVFINLGAGSVESGEVLQVMAKGEELIDPETGISLGGDDTYLGDIEVVNVKDKFSIARPVSMNQLPSRGDKVISTKVAEPMQFAENWRSQKKKKRR